MRHLLACLLWLMPIAAEAGCRVTPLATVAVTQSAGVPVVPVMLNGVAARFVLDTGAERTVVTPEAASRLGLARDPWVATSMHGVSGAIERTRNATPRTITLGGVKLQHRSVARDSSLVVATLPRIAAGPPLDGLLGRDFLAGFDLALDPRAGSLSLYDVMGCSGRFLPWTFRYTELPVQVMAGNAFVLPARIDGTALRALLDTGANTSLLAAPGMARLRITTAEATGRFAAGLGPRAVMVGVRRFDTLAVGPELRRAPILALSAAHLVPIVDLLLGQDWIAGRPLWISYSTGRLFIAAAANP
jgi:hypothetical protein